MCDPISIATLAISAASTTAGFIGQQQEADQNRANAVKAFADTQSALGAREVQEQDSAGLQKFDADEKGQAARSTAAVQAGEAGVSGISVDSLLNDFTGRTGRYTSTVDQQTGWNLDQLQREKTGAFNQATSQIASMPQPSFIDAGLRIAAAGFNADSDYTRRTGNQGVINSVFS